MERRSASPPAPVERVRWHAHIEIEKRPGDWTAEQIARGEAPEPEEVWGAEGNLLLTAGAKHVWQSLRGDSLTAFDNTNSYVGVGDSSTTPTLTDTDLNAATNKLRKGMDTGFPKVGTADGLATDNLIRFESSFGPTEANFAWLEMGVFNHATAGVMLMHRLITPGTKTGGTWTARITFDLTST